MFHDAMFLRKARAGGASIPVRVGVGSWGEGTASSGISAAKPAGVVNGDFLITVVWSNSTTAVVTAPGGWTKVFGDLGGGQLPGLEVYTKTAGGSEPASYAWSASGGTLFACVLAYRGGANAVDVVGNYTTNSSSTVSTASGFTAINSGVLIGLFMMRAVGRTVSSAPSGMTQITLATTFASRAIYDMTPSAAGSVATRTLTWSGATNYVGGLALQIR